MTRDDFTAGGGSRAGAVITIFLVLALGLLLGWFKYSHVYSGYDGLKVDLLAEDENPALPATIRNAARERVSARGGDTTVVWLEGDRLTVPFDLEKAQTYRLKMKVYLQESAHPDRTVRVEVNGAPLSAFTPEWSGAVEVLEVNVPAQRLRQGGNTITLAVARGSHRRVGVEFAGIKNYVGISKNFPRAFVIFDGNYGGGGFRALRAASDFLLYPAAVFLLWLVSANIAAAAGVGIGTALRKALYVYMPTAAAVASAALFSAATSYTVITAYDTLLAFLIAPAAAYGLYHLVRIVTVSVAGKGGAPEKDKGLGTGPGLEIPRPGSPLAILARRLSTTAILGFMACLLAAAVLLVFKKQALAERLADIAYFSLVFGVVARVLDLRKEEG